ncbi:MAG: hypothetical protein JNK64_19260 [Myxococcales bacterium]|nr:hypothetical protein [Myxococcales bacterium]
MGPGATGGAAVTAAGDAGGGDQRQPTQEHECANSFHRRGPSPVSIARSTANRRAFAIVVGMPQMHTKTLVIGLTLAVALGGGYLYRATRGQATSPAPATTAPAPAPSSAPAPSGPRPGRSLDTPAAAPTAAAATPPGPTAAAPTPTTAAALPVGTPGVHIDVLDRIDDAPGVTDATDHARADLAAPPPLTPEAAEALADARAAFRRGDYAAARGTARKLLAIAPDNDAARRLAVSASCRLHDADGARAAAAAIAPDQRAAVARYCAAAGVSLDGAP